MTLEVLQRDAHEWTDAQRPATRGECKGGPRPCPWASCRYHLALDLTKHGHIVYRHSVPIEEMEHTCALDVADSGEKKTKKHVGDLMGLSRERVRQIVEEVLPKMRESIVKERAKHARRRGD